MRGMYLNGGAELERVFRRAKSAGCVTSLDMAAIDPSSEARAPGLARNPARRPAVCGFLRAQPRGTLLHGAARHARRCHGGHRLGQAQHKRACSARCRRSFRLGRPQPYNQVRRGRAFIAAPAAERHSPASRRRWGEMCQTWPDGAGSSAATSRRKSCPVRALAIQQSPRS